MQLLCAELAERLLPARLPLGALVLDLASAGIREATDHYTPVAVGAGALDVPTGREVGEHLSDAGGCELRGVGELSGGERAAVIQLDQQLELRMAHLPRREVGVTPAQTAQVPEHSFEGLAQIGQ